MKVAFIVGDFPTISTFIIDQVAGLLDHGIDVQIFALDKVKIDHNISQKFFDYKMQQRTHYLVWPHSWIERIILAAPKFLRILFSQPALLKDVFNAKKYGRNALSLKLLFWIEPFLGKKFDIVHCHFGTTANKFLIIREILNIKVKIITTFYGYDVSHLFKTKGKSYYDKLKKIGSLFFVMSEDMKQRVVRYGFDADKVIVHPVGIDVEEYHFQSRVNNSDSIDIASVGRFVEKKGFDDLLRALEIVKKKTAKNIKCHIIGGGPLEEDLKKLTTDLNINDIVTYHGYMQVEEVLNFFKNIDLFIQPSKTAKNGDME